MIRLSLLLFHYFCIRTVYVNVSPTPASVALTLFITFNPEEFTTVITVLLGTVTVIGGSVDSEGNLQ